MQKLLIGILSAATVALAVVCVIQNRQLQAARLEAQAAEQAVAVAANARDVQAERAQELARANAQLEQQVQKFATVTMQLRTNEARQASDLATLSQCIRASGKASGGSSADGEGAEGNFGAGVGQMLGTMMKDPAMREMLREQQKAAVNMLYAGLFKELQLSPDEQQALKEALTDAQMKNVEAAQGMFGNTNSAGLEESRRAMEESKKQSEEQIRALLGPERYATFDDYQKSIGERVQLDQFKAQLAGQNALQDQQASQLLQILKEEKAAAPPAIPTDNAQLPRPELFTSENMDRQVKWMEDYNRRVLDRAGQVLSPEQLSQYRAFQEQQLSMQKISLRMARQMFGGASSSAPAR